MLSIVIVSVVMVSDSDRLVFVVVMLNLVMKIGISGWMVFMIVKIEKFVVIIVVVMC